MPSPLGFPLEPGSGVVREERQMVVRNLEPHGARTANATSHDVTRTASEAAQSEQAAYRGDLRLQGSGGYVSVRGNAIKLCRAITSLLNNATRAAGPDGRVLAGLHRAESRMLLTAGDSGPGSGPIRCGSGLGLRAAARSLKSCGGHIEHSRTEVGGARATLVPSAIDS